MKENIKNLQKLGNQINLDLFYSISFFTGTEVSLQGKATQVILHELLGYCENFKHENTNLIGYFEYEGTNYRVILTF